MSDSPKRPLDADAHQPAHKKQTLNPAVGGQFFVVTNTDTCICLEREKLFTRAPNSWFAKLIAHRASGDTTGDSQANPMRVGLPTWFVQGVADWTQPMSTTNVSFFRQSQDVREMLQIIGWSRDDPLDLPVMLPKLCTPLRGQGPVELIKLALAFAPRCMDPLLKDPVLFNYASTVTQTLVQRGTSVCTDDARDNLTFVAPDHLEALKKMMLPRSQPQVGRMYSQWITTESCIVKVTYHCQSTYDKISIEMLCNRNL